MTFSVIMMFCLLFFVANPVGVLIASGLAPIIVNEPYKIKLMVSFLLQLISMYYYNYYVLLQFLLYYLIFWISVMKGFH